MDQVAEEDIRSRYEDICAELNLDEIAKTSAWEAYMNINNDYVLEGNHIEWLACALYVACRSCSTKTVEGKEHNGNSISLTQILKATGLNLIEFFRKIKKWLEMAKLPQGYLDKVEALERKFEVISVIFKKYESEFCEVFVLQEKKQTTGSSVGRPRSRKPSRARPCTSTDLFKFGWVLYIHVKNQFPLISDDLVNSHYLLLCCIALLSSAAITSKRKDLLNPDFSGLPEDFHSQRFVPPAELPGVLPDLCKRFSAIERECLVVHDYYWWPSVRKLYETQILMGAGSRTPELSSVLSSLLTPANFQANVRHLRDAYETVMFSEGDFDERMFLNGNGEAELVLAYKKEDIDSLQPGVIYQSPQHLQYGTPLTGMEYLSSKEAKLTPVSDANQSVIQLHLLLEECRPEPSEYLSSVFCSCASNPEREIKLRLEAMSHSFLQSFQADAAESPDNFALLRLQLSQALYFKLLGAIVEYEEKKVTSADGSVRYSSIQTVLEHDPFHRSLFSCCIEIVLFSYNSHSRIFPWVLGITNLSPYHFYKVVEVIIKVEPGFPRGIIKHLSKIEETILGYLAWKSDSPLFNAIDAAGSVPTYQEVLLPDGPAMGYSPFQSRLRGSGRDVTPSPLSAKDRYTASPTPARRQLFSPSKQQQQPLPPPASSSSSSPGKQLTPIAPKPPVRVTPIVQLFSLLQQQNKQNQTPGVTVATPKTSTQTTPSVAAQDSIQALVSLAAMTSPLKISPDKNKNVTSGVPSSSSSDSPVHSSSAPIITVSCPSTPTAKQPQTPQKQGAATPSATVPKSSSPPRPKRTGSVALFYRKVYQMAFLRIKDLCERLTLREDILQKVWMCFEHSLVRSPNLMRDRHIDQVIMCAIYVVCKVLHLDVTFQEIMRQYRHQPQAKSHVYRSVLLNNGPRVSVTSCSQQEQDSALGGDSQPFGDGHSSAASLDSLLYRSDIPVDARGDIIQFYNRVYIAYIKDFVLKFSQESDASRTQLSPLPVIKRPAMSPRKLSRNHQIYISPLKGGSHPSLSPLAKTYVVSKSPASDLHELNQIVGASSSAVRVGAKRQLIDPLISSSPSVGSPAKRTRSSGPRGPPNLLMQKAILMNNDRTRMRLANGTVSSSTTLPSSSSSSSSSMAAVTSPPSSSDNMDTTD